MSKLSHRRRGEVAAVTAQPWQGLARVEPAIPELKSFSSGLRTDLAAVQAALKTKLNNG